MRAQEIAPLLPHAGAMCWLHRLLHADDDGVIAEADIGTDHLMAVQGRVPGWAGIEFMAQAVAAWAGRRAHARGEAVKPGFLLGTRRYQSALPEFAVGSTLRVEAHCELFGDNGLGMFSCRILIAGEEVASAQLSVYEPPNPAAFEEAQRTP